MSAATQANHDFSKEHGNKDEKVDQFAANVSVFAKKALQRKKLARVSLFESSNESCYFNNVVLINHCN